MAKFEMNVYLERWLQTNAYRAMPRMPNWITQDDLVQEGKYCWTVVNDRYYDVVTEVAHMVALFKTTYQRRVVDIINDKRNPRKESSLDQLLEDGIEFSGLATDADIENLILEAPEPIKTILHLLVTDEKRIVSAPYRVYLDGTRDTLNNRLHRALRRYDFDVAPNTDLLNCTRRYLRASRERLYEEPSVVEIVGALVEERLTVTPKVQQPTLHLAANALAKAKENLRKQQSKVRPRVRIFPVIEVRKHGKAINRDHPQGRIRRGTPDPQSREQMQERTRTSIRPRVHGDWATCRYQRPQQRGDGSRLRCAEATNERARCRPMGSCVPMLQRRHIHANGLESTGPRTQDSPAPLHSNSRKPSCTSLQPACHPPGRSWADTDTREAVRNPKLLG